MNPALKLKSWSLFEFLIQIKRKMSWILSFVQVLADGKRKFYLNEGIVKAAKDLVTNIQSSKSDSGKKVSVRV